MPRFRPGFRGARLSVGIGGPPPGAGGWVVARFGAYMYYAVARTLHKAGRLERLYTDLYAPGALGKWVARAPQAIRPSLLGRVAGRHSAEIPADRVRSFPAFATACYMRRSCAHDAESRSFAYLRAGERFGRLVAQSGFGDARAVYAFNTAALEIFEAAKRAGLYTALDQTIAPRAFEEDALAEEQARFHGWEPPRLRGSATLATIERERREWALADMILCPSEFVRQAIAHCGGPVERCVVAPYGADQRYAPSPSKPRVGPLRVLTIGEVGLRKGIGYAAAVAEMLKGVAEFRWIGAVSLVPRARAEVGRRIDLTGIVPNIDICRHYAWADVFFLPTVCEGSATTIYEALLSGLPVVTTPHAGSIVRDGVDGFVTPVRDADAMAAALDRLASDRSLLERMRAATRDSAKMASMENYQARLRSILLPGVA